GWGGGAGVVGRWKAAGGRDRCGGCGAGGLRRQVAPPGRGAARARGADRGRRVLRRWEAALLGRVRQVGQGLGSDAEGEQGDRDGPRRGGRRGLCLARRGDDRHRRRRGADQGPGGGQRQASAGVPTGGEEVGGRVAGVRQGRSALRGRRTVGTAGDGRGGG